MGVGFQYDGDTPECNKDMGRGNQNLKPIANNELYLMPIYSHSIPSLVT